MAFNELEAIRMIDNGDISDKEIQFLASLRHGKAKADVEKDASYQSLMDKGLAQLAALSHPRASVTVDAVIPTEEGTTVLNLFDKRYRENTGASRDANTAADVDPKMVKHPTEEEARKVPSIEAKPLDADKKGGNVPDSKELKEAMKDPIFATGGKDLSQANNERVIADNAKVVVDGSKFDHDGDGKVGGSKRK